MQKILCKWPNVVHYKHTKLKEQEIMAISEKLLDELLKELDADANTPKSI